MTIDDFIDTYKSYAEDYRKETYNMGYSTQQRDYARDKAREYEQIAEWLEELKAIKENTVFYSSRPIEDIVLEARADAIDEVKTVINEITKEHIKIYGADIIELYVEVVEELNIWIEKQLKEKKNDD